MSYIQILLAALSVAKEFIQYLKAKDKCKTARVEHAKVFAKELKNARKEGDTTKLESVFGRPGAGMQDK